MQQIFDNLARKKFLELIRYNKILKNFLNIRKNAYKKEFAKIEIVIFPREEVYGQFINIPENYGKYFHIFLMIIKKKQKIVISVKVIKFQK